MTPSTTTSQRNRVTADSGITQVVVAIVGVPSLVREAFEALVATDSRLRIASYSSRNRPDVLLTAASTPAVLRSAIARAAVRKTPMVVLLDSVSFSTKSIVRARLASEPAFGALTTRSSARHLSMALRAVAAGRTMVTSDLASDLDDAWTGHLSSRQIEVLSRIAHGDTNRQIAEYLGIGVETVKTHIRVILRELRCASRTQAVKQAVELGILNRDSRGGDGLAPSPPRSGW